MKKSDKLPTLHEIINDQPDVVFPNGNFTDIPVTSSSSEIFSGETIPILNTVNKSSDPNIKDLSADPLTDKGNIVLAWARQKALLDIFNIKTSGI